MSYQSLKQLLVFVIIFQLAVPHQLVFAQSTPTPPPEENQFGENEVAKDYADILANNPAIRAEVASLETTADAIANGSFKINPAELISFYMPGQYVVPYKNNQPGEPIRLDELNAPINLPGYSTLRPGIDPVTREVFVEALKGVNANGEGGEIIARQYIPNLKALAVSIDASRNSEESEFLVILDEKGNISASDWGFIKQRVFKDEYLPIIPKIWEQSSTQHEVLRSGKIRIYTYTLGARPFTESDFGPEAVIPKNEKNQMEVGVGDFIVSYLNAQGEEKIYGIFKRGVIYNDLVAGAAFLTEQMISFRPTGEIAENANEIKSLLEKRQKEIKRFEAQESDPIVENFYRRVGPEYVNFLATRAKDLDDYSQRDFDRVGYDEMNAQFRELVTKYSQTTGVTLEQLSNDDYEVLRRNWKKFVPGPDTKETVVSRTGRTPLARTPFQKLSDFLGKSSVKKTILIGGSIVGAAYLGIPYAMDYIQTSIDPSSQLQYFVTWAYEKLYFPVFKDSNYRSFLYLSTLSLLSFIPIVFAISAAAKKAIQTASLVAGNSNSQFAMKVRDMSRTWIDMSNIQRIVSFTIRLYAKLIYPVIRFTVEQVLRQKTFIPAVNKGINPFQRIEKGSLVGRKLQLSEDTRPGVNTPTASGETVTLKQRAVVVLADQQNKAANLAWKIAVLTVAAKGDIDPVTLQLVLSGKVPLNKLDTILSDERVAKEWNILGQEFYRELLRQDITQTDFENMDEAKVKEYFKVANDMLEKLKNTRNIGLIKKEMGFKARALSKKIAMVLLTTGYKESKFLSSIRASTYTADQTQREFIMDYVPTTLTMAVVGARADLARPSYLAADPNGYLWTNQGHLSDIVYQVYLHLVMSGATTALVFQSDALNTVPEDRYTRLEELQLEPEVRAEPLGRGLLGWANALHPLNGISKSRIEKGYAEHLNISHYGWKTFLKRFATIQAGMTTSILTTYYMMNMDPSSDHKFTLMQAVGTAMLGLFAAQWYYRFVWDFVRRLSHFDETRLNESKKAFQRVQIKIKRGLDRPDSESARAQIAEGYREMLGLYGQTNKAVFKQVSLTIRALKNNQLTQLYEELMKEYAPLNPGEREYFGVILDIITKLQNRQNKDAEESIELLRKYLAKDPTVDLNVLKRLSAKSILQLSIENPPVYTTTNKLIGWLGVFGAGFLTTYIGSELFAKMYDAKFLVADFIVPWMYMSFAYFIPYALLLDAKAWKFYYTVYQDLRESPMKIVNRIREKYDDLMMTRTTRDARAAEALAFSCQGVFGR